MYMMTYSNWKWHECHQIIICVLQCHFTYINPVTYITLFIIPPEVNGDSSKFILHNRHIKINFFSNINFFGSTCTYFWYLISIFIQIYNFKHKEILGLTTSKINMMNVNRCQSEIHRYKQHVIVLKMS